MEAMYKNDTEKPSQARLILLTESIQARDNNGDLSDNVAKSKYGSLYLPLFKGLSFL